MILLGFALTEHCNLRCPHCIRDDVTQVRNLDPALVERTVDDALALFGEVTASFTGGEPTLHPAWDRITAAMHARGVPYRFVSNGWHMRRLMPGLDRHPPQAVRLSLSGATEAVHDEERGRGSFRRVLQAVALLTSRRIPTALSIVIDRRDRHQIATAAQLAEALGCVRIHFILPQPVTGSVERGSDLDPHEWMDVRREVEALAAVPGRRTLVQMDYGAPWDGPEESCDTFALNRVYVDARGRLSICCQLSEYGFNETDVVADLTDERLSDVWPRFTAAMAQLQHDSRPGAFGADDPYDAFPCMRCARARGKTAWLSDYPDSAWHGMAAAPAPPLVTLGYRRSAALAV